LEHMDCGVQDVPLVWYECEPLPEPIWGRGGSRVHHDQSLKVQDVRVVRNECEPCPRGLLGRRRLRLQRRRLLKLLCVPAST